jgi:hypothetical protein
MSRNRLDIYADFSTSHGFLECGLCKNFVIGSKVGKPAPALIGNRCSIGMAELFYACSELTSSTTNLPPVQRRALSVGIQR